MGKSNPQWRERELALREAGSKRWDMVVGAIANLVTFPLYIVDKLRWAIGLSLIGYFLVFKPLSAVAGEKTEVLLSAVLDLAINDWVYWLVIFILTGGNIVVGKSYRRYVRIHGHREKVLEAQLDPNRTTSGLTPSGTSPKKTEQQNDG